jgi:ABC-type uncharacterized transport system ATPase subunit
MIFLLTTVEDSWFTNEAEIKRLEIGLDKTKKEIAKFEEKYSMNMSLTDYLRSFSIGT